MSIMLQYSKQLLLLPLRLLGIGMTEVVRTCSAFVFNASRSILETTLVRFYSLCRGK